MSGFDIRLQHTTSKQRAVTIANARAMLEKVDRTLSGNKKVKVKEADASGPPAFTMLDHSININFWTRQFQDMHGDEALAHLIGLNHHEVGHVIFSNKFEDLHRVEPKLDSGYKDVWNALEDGRQERLTIGKYVSAAPFFVLLMNNMFKAQLQGGKTDPRTVLGVYPVAIMRRNYMPTSFTDLARDAYIAAATPILEAAHKNGLLTQWTADTLADAIADKGDEYLPLTFPGDEKKAAQIVLDFWKLVSVLLTPDMPSLHGAYGAHGGQSPTSNTEQKEAGDKADADDQQYGPLSEYHQELLDGEHEDDKAQGAGGKSDDDPDDDDADDQDGEGSSEDDSSGAQKAAGGSDTGDQGNAPSDVPGKSGAGSGPMQDAVDAIKDALDDISKSLMDTEDVVNQLQEHKRSIAGTRVFNTALDRMKVSAAPKRDVEPQMLGSARRVGAVFAKMRSNLDPGWRPDQASGKLDLRRYLKGDPLDTVFNSWDEDLSEAADIELALLLDMSQSMLDHNMHVQASKTCWILREAIKAIDGKVTGYGFSSESKLIFDREEANPRTKFPVWNFNGGTHVGPALGDASVMMSRSKMRNKLVIVLTDGAFNDGLKEVSEHCTYLRATGCYVVRFILTNGYSYAQYDPCFDANITVHDPIQMVPQVTTIVNNLIARNRTRAR